MNYKVSLKRKSAWTLVLFLLFSVLINASTASVKKKSSADLKGHSPEVLLLFSFNYGLPAYDKIAPAIVSAMKNAGISPNNLYFEYLDMQRGDEASVNNNLASSIKDKYKNKKIDLIITVHVPALEFLRRNCQGAFPGVPVIALLAPENLSPGLPDNKVVLLPINPDFDGTLKIATGLLPSTKRVVYVSGKSLEDSTSEASAKKAFQNWKGKLEFTYTDSLSIEQIERLTSTLPQNTIVLFSSFFSDVTGQSFQPYDVWARLGRTCNVPVFGLYDVMLNNGVIGGSMISFEEEGSRAAKIAVDVLQGTFQLSKPVTVIPSDRVAAFDWKMLSAWRLDDKPLPEGSRVINYEPTFWEKYSLYVIFIMAFIILQWVLISLLLIQRRQKKAALEAMNQSEKKYRELFEANKDGISIFYVNQDDSLSRFIETNDAAAEMLGYTKEEFLAFFPPDLEDVNPLEVVKQRRDNILTYGFDSFETKLKHKEGHKVDVEVKVIPLVFEGRMALMNIVRDISARKQAETALKESEEKFRHAFEYSGTGTWILGIDGKIQKINSAIKDILGYNENEIVGASFNDFTITDHIVPSLSWYNKLIAGESDNAFFEKQYKRKDGKIITCQVSTSLIRDINKQPDFFITHIIDITEAKNAELELKKHKEHLEEIVKERTEKLLVEIKKKEEAEALLKDALAAEKDLNELKSRFISTASHEFRTPLTSVLMSAEIIQRYFHKWPPEKINENLERIKSAVTKLTGLMDDVISINRSDAGKVVLMPRECDVFDLCNKVIDDSHIRLRNDLNFVFTFSGERRVFNLDPKQVETILQNLLSNAIKYSVEGGMVEFKVTTRNEEIKVVISDTGIGIPDADIPRLFEPFHRADNAINVQGTGLGLSIVKNSVILHKGKIEVESKLGKGTSFIVTLPSIEA